MHLQNTFLLSLGMATAGSPVLGAAAALTTNPLPSPPATGTTGNDVSRILNAPQVSCTIFDYLGWIDKGCNYYDGLGMHEGAHHECATYCAELGDYQPDCYDARCKQRAFQHGGEGQCYCPCGTRIVCYDRESTR